MLKKAQLLLSRETTTFNDVNKAPIVRLQITSQSLSQFENVSLVVEAKISSSSMWIKIPLVSGIDDMEYIQYLEKNTARQYEYDVKENGAVPDNGSAVKKTLPNPAIIYFPLNFALSLGYFTTYRYAIESDGQGEYYDPVIISQSISYDHHSGKGVTCSIKDDSTIRLQVETTDINQAGIGWIEHNVVVA